jgi:hypothetical protein
MRDTLDLTLGDPYPGLFCPLVVNGRQSGLVLLFPRLRQLEREMGDGLLYCQLDLPHLLFLLGLSHPFFLCAPVLLCPIFLLLNFLSFFPLAVRSIDVLSAHIINSFR